MADSALSDGPAIDLDRSAHEHAAALRAGEYGARALAEATLARVEAQEPDLNAYIRVTPEQALAQADAADERLRAGDPAPLTGIPVGLKDVLSTRGVETTAGSRILEGFTPIIDCTVVARLREQGAVFVGKTNLDEFAMGSSTEHSAYGATRNPWDLTRVPGGSSGGSAATRRGARCRDRPRHRHGRLDPPAGRADGHRRPQAQLRPRQPLRRRRLRLLAGAGRAVRPRRPRRGHAAAGDRRARPQRRDHRPRARARLHRALRSRPRGPARRRPRRGVRHGPRGRRARGVRAGAGAVRARGARSSIARSRCPRWRSRSPPTTSSRPPKPRRTSPATTVSSTVIASGAAKACGTRWNGPAVTASATR